MSHSRQSALLAVGLCILIAGGCTKDSDAESAAPDSVAATTLKDAFEGSFLIGAAINAEQFGGQDTAGAALVKRQFNAISPENVLKWEVVHPELGRYDFTGADQYVDFGEKNGMFVHGHTLVWHSQVPDWVFEDGAGNAVSRDTLLARMKDHITTVVGRYKGRIDGWDVVNEALNEDGTLRETRWQQIIGDDYIATAFQLAHEADPGAELYYNDYSLENPAKRDGAVRLIRSLQEAGVTITGIGSQEHLKLDWPSPALVDSMITAFASTGLQVNMSELDVDVLPRATRGVGADVSTNVAGNSALNPFPTALPDSLQQRLAQRYAEIFEVYMKHAPHIDRVTFWGVDDADSWLNNWPVEGRTNYPLLFDRDGHPKPAFDAVVQTAR